MTALLTKLTHMKFVNINFIFFLLVYLLSFWEPESMLIAVHEEVGWVSFLIFFYFTIFLFTFGKRYL